jgi:hypothetical protein
MYHDLDLYGNDNSKGEANVHYDEDAIKSAFTTWLTSKRGDFLKLPDEGGVFDFSLFKKMNPDMVQIINHEIKTAIINNFFPSVTLLGLSITPDYEHRMWIIEIKYENPLTLTTQTVQIYTKDLTTKTTQTFETIEYQELNLKNWVVLMKPGMKGKLLIFNTEKDSWVWGKYLLTNFSYSDPYFSEILILCNTRG